MARLNIKQKTDPVFTHEGGRAVSNLTPEQALRRSLMSCLLWEDGFYEDGTTIAERINENAAKLKPAALAAMAIEARNTGHLRHAPLLLLLTLIKTGSGQGSLVADTISKVVKRVDEMAELLALYWAKTGNKHMIPAQLRKGLAVCFRQFDEYQLAKYDRPDKIKLRDVLRLARPKPDNKKQSNLFKRVKEGKLKTPDTWEVELSAGGDKKKVFTRLIKESKLGYLALLRNLRNMAQSGVDEELVREALLARKGAHNVYPFRYVAAARAVPQFEPYLDEALLSAVSEMPVLPGKSIVLVDVSTSMSDPMSGKSDMKRIDAAAALASIIPGDRRVFLFNNTSWEVPARSGMAGVDAITKSVSGGTMLGAAVTHMNGLKHDRLIVITDEQSADRVPDPVAKHAYMINVAANKNGVGYGKWTHIDGFSEGVLRFINEAENDR